MPDAAEATTWTCARCAVTVSFMKGTAAPAMPATWNSEEGVLHCLDCRRSLAGDAGVLGLAADAPVEQRQRQRSHSRIEFEIGRDPTRPDNKIAKACHTSVIAVRNARTRMGLDARPPRVGDGDA